MARAPHAARGPFCVLRDMAWKISIRPEHPDDFSTVERLVEEAFRPLAISDHTEHLLVAALRRSESFIPALSLVAEIAPHRIVGQVLLTRIAVAGESGVFDTLGVAPLSVAPAFQRQGVGTALMHEAHRRARRLGFTSALLVGHAAFYARLGYLPASRFGIRFPFDAPNDCCLAVELVPGALSGISGVVRYPAAFGIPGC